MPDDPETSNPTVQEHTRRIVAQAPPLSEDQRAKIVALLSAR